MNDILFNILAPLALLALAVRTVIALDARNFGRAVFSFFLNLMILRLITLRWFSGATKSGVKPDTQIVGWLTDPTLLNSLTVAFVIGLVWTTVDEYFEARERRRRAKQREKEPGSILK